MTTFAYFLPSSASDEMPSDFVMDLVTSIREVENLLEYNFKNKKLLEEALTHPSVGDATSYQRLEFVGDAALGLAISNYLYLAYPDLDPGYLSLLRAANVSTEKLARVAVRHGLYRYIRHNTFSLDEKVSGFISAVEQEDKTVVYGGVMKAPKMLADIVESVAAAVYVDCGFDLVRLWVIFRRLLEPIITLDILQQHPVTLLYELCQKDGKQVDIKQDRQGQTIIASVFVDGQFVVSASSDQRENARLHAAKAALEKFSYGAAKKLCLYICGESNTSEGAKQKLHDLCGKKKWAKPCYRVEKEIGPAHERRYVCSVQIKLGKDVLFVTGDEKSRLKDAESSAALMMLDGLQDSKYIQ